MNQNPAWKYLALVALVSLSLIYALPNIFGNDLGVQVIGLRGTEVNQQTLQRVESALKRQNVEAKTIALEGETIRLRLNDAETQLKSQRIIDEALGDRYSTALALMPSTPEWLRNMSAAPMFLGLDLRGGVHLLMEVDMESAQRRAEDSYVDDIKTQLRENKVRYLSVARSANGKLLAKFRTEALRDAGEVQIRRNYPDLTQRAYQEGERFYIDLTLSDAAISEIRDAALRKNMIALRSRVDELGVSEPIIQQQGDNRIVVQLPGVQDSARAKEILGKTATLEIYLVDEDNALRSSIDGRVPVGSKRYYYRDGTPILLKKRLIYSGENIIDAGTGIDSQQGGAVVNVTLDSKGASINRKVTGENINRRMAVVYVENRIDNVTDASGQTKRKLTRIEEVITAPVIRDQLGSRYQISGIGSSAEANDLALLLRAGSLAAPVYIIEERTVGPSLGAENIAKGFASVVYGFLAVLVFMIIYYRIFGGVASFALVLNLVIIVAVLSLFQATLTLPGVAGMVLTVGMAVDANVLIFERIREELRDGQSPQVAIHQGYDNAFSTIIDANITTLIAALVLFNFGTGPIQGFAVTLSIGILSSMVTAIFVTRVVVNLIYGGRRLQTLTI